MSGHAADVVRFGTVVLTGATSGIGAATAQALAARADHLVLLGRESSAAAEPALAAIRSGGDAAIDYVPADYTELAQVRDAATRVLSLAPRIDLLINDAGMPGLPERVMTVDGNERTLQVNALGAALLTSLLVPALGDGSRIVNVCSAAHHVDDFDPADPGFTRGYSAVDAYARSKSALLAWSLAQAERLRPSGIDVVALCPGLNDTPLSAAMMGRIGGPPVRGARLVLRAAETASPTGTYFEGGSPASPSPAIRDSGYRSAVEQCIAERITLPVGQ